MRFLFFLLTLSLACQAQYTSRVSAAPSQTDLPAVASWVALFEANRQTAVADGTAISTLSDSSGNARDATQTGSARPVYKIAANGINSQPVIRFTAASSQYMRATTGGASLTGDFYMCALVKFTSGTGYQQVLCFGNDSTGQRRAMLRYSAGEGNFFGFNGQSADITPKAPVTAFSTAYFCEIIRSGSTISIYVNGALSSQGTPTLSAYSSTALNIGTNNAAGAGEFLNGDVAFCGFIGSAPATATLNKIRGYVQSIYGVAFLAGKATFNFIPYSTLPGPLANSAVCDTGLEVGIYDRRFWAYYTGTGRAHGFFNNDAGNGTAFFQNFHSAGYSALDFFGHDVDVNYAVTAYGGAVGFGNTGLSDAFVGAAYLEGYDLGSATPKAIRLVQSNNAAHYRRIDIEAGGNIVFYRRNADYPGETKILTIKESGVLNFNSIPTSSAGLSSGDVYSNLGILTIVP